MFAKIENWSAKGYWDNFGLGLTGLCFLHCVASAVFVTILASAGGILLHPAIHEVGIIIALIIAAIALVSGFMRHRYILPLFIGSIGLAIMIGAQNVPHGDSNEIVYTMLGLLVLALSHHLNYRASR